MFLFVNKHTYLLQKFKPKYNQNIIAFFKLLVKDL